MADTSQPPDDKRLFILLQDVGLDAKQAYTFVQELRTMAAQNFIARFESKLDALTSTQTARLDALSAAVNAKMDAQTSKFNLMLWFIGIGVTLIIAIGGVFVSTLFS